MASPRIDDLRRRVEKDPASIAFAQLAEEYRRAGQFQEAVDVCRAGLTIHPAYLSARVTLGRALIELNQLEDAQAELEQVLKSAPENLAAIRGLAEIHHRRGSLSEALAQYRAALNLARNDPDLEQTINDLARKVEPPKPAHANGLSFEQARQELSIHAPAPAPAPPLVPPVAPAAAAPEAAGTIQPEQAAAREPSAAARAAPPIPEPNEFAEFSSVPDSPTFELSVPAAQSAAPEPSRLRVDDSVPTPVAASIPAGEPVDDPARAHATRTIAALEQWLDAIHAARTDRGA